MRPLVLGTKGEVPDAGLATGRRTTPRRGRSPRPGPPRTSIPERRASIRHLQLPYLGTQRIRSLRPGGERLRGLPPRRRMVGCALLLGLSSHEPRPDALLPSAPRIPPLRTHPGANLILFCPPFSGRYPRRVRRRARPMTHRPRRGQGELPARDNKVRALERASESIRGHGVTPRPGTAKGANLPFPLFHRKWAPGTPRQLRRLEQFVWKKPGSPLESLDPETDGDFLHADSPLQGRLTKKGTLFRSQSRPRARDLIQLRGTTARHSGTGTGVLRNAVGPQRMIHPLLASWS